MGIGGPEQPGHTLPVMLMGAGGIIGQIVLMRELIITFQGNELTIGIILANWLLIEGLGSLAGAGAASRRAPSLRLITLVQGLFAVFLPVCLFASRAASGIWGLQGLPALFVMSAVVLFPAAFTHGMLFPLWNSILESGGKVQAAGRTYVTEMAGTVFGGVALSFVLNPFVQPLITVLSISLLNLLCSVMVALRGGSRRLAIIHLPLVLLSAVSILPGPSSRIRLWSLEHRWRGHHLLHQHSGVHGTLAVTGGGGQFTFHRDGVPVLTTPHGDLQRNEMLAHLPMLSHPRPERVLVIGGGAGGLLTEVLKHRPRLVAYAELDPDLLNLLKLFPTPETERELSHPSVETVTMDGRRYLEREPGGWDVVIVGLGMPDDLQTNRLYTGEFFSLASKRMAPGGVLGLMLPGSPSYLPEEMARLNRAVELSLGDAFPRVTVVPGEENLFLATSSEAPFSRDTLIKRLNLRQVETVLLGRAHLDYVLEPIHLHRYRQAVDGLPDLRNTDARPLGVFYGMVHWNRLFSPESAGVFHFFQRVAEGGFPFYHLSILLILPLALWLLPVRRPAAAIPPVVFTSGFSAMMLDLAVVYSFQVLFGHLYQWLGVLFAAFMAGAATGALKTGRSPMNQRRRLLLLDVSIVLLLMAFPLLVKLFALLKGVAGYSLSSAAFLVLPFLAGFLTGGQFPPAVSLLRESGGMEERGPGVVYGSDLLGGWLGGIVGGVFLLPLMGVQAVLLLTAWLKTISVLCLVVTGKSIRKVRGTLP